MKLVEPVGDMKVVGRGGGGGGLLLRAKDSEDGYGYEARVELVEDESAIEPALA